MSQSSHQLNPTPSIREVLDTLAEQDTNDLAVQRGVAPGRLRSLSRIADQIADEHGIAQPGTEVITVPTPSRASLMMQQDLGHITELAGIPATTSEGMGVGVDAYAPQPHTYDHAQTQQHTHNSFNMESLLKSNPLEDLARVIKSFTFGTMMTLAKELKATEHANFETPEGVAALLDCWATKVLKESKD